MAKYKLSWKTVLDGTAVARKKGGSWGWQSLQWGLELLQGKVGIIPGSQSEIPVLGRPWVYGESPLLKGGLTGGEAPPHFCTVKFGDLVVAGDWDRRQLNCMFEEGTVLRILSMPIPEPGQRDSFVWTESTSGKYSVKSGYWQALEGKKQQANDIPRLQCFARKHCYHLVDWKVIWHIPGPNKWKCFIWKLMVGALPVGFEFVRQQMAMDFGCCLCQEGVCETVEHLFRDCSLAQRVWKGGLLGLDVSWDHTIPFPLWVNNWLKVMRKDDHSGTRLGWFIGTLWAIWCHRNQRIFRGSAVNISAIFAQVKEVVGAVERGLLKTGESNKNLPSSQESGPVTFAHHLIGTGIGCSRVRIMTDGAWSSLTEAGIGWVAIDSNGERIMEKSYGVLASSPIQVEGKAIVDAVQWAISAELRHVEILTDCKALIQQLEDAGNAQRDLRTILCSINYLASSFHCLSFVFIPRRLNGLAHKLASKAVSL